MKINYRLSSDIFSTPGNGKRFFIILVLLLAISLIFYFSGIQDYFIADSLVGLSLNWRDVWTEFASQGGVDGYRPLGVAWFVLNNTLWGDWVFGHRLMALALHAANGALLFLIAYRLKNNLKIASLAALLFITLPVQVETVQWLAATAGSATSTLFFLFSVWFWIKPAGMPGVKQKLLSAIFFVLALFTKEISAALPITVFFLDWHLNKVKSLKHINDYLKWVISYWPFAISFIIYFSGSYFSGTFHQSYAQTTNGYNNFTELFNRFDNFFNVMLLPFSGFIEWRIGYVSGLWTIVFLFILHLSKSARIFFVLTLLNLFPGIFYFADRLTYLPMIFFSLGISVLCIDLFRFLHRIITTDVLKNLFKVFVLLVLTILLVMNYRFVNRKLEPWHNAARLCKTIPEKVYQLLPNPEPQSQIILVDMTFSPGIPVKLWAIFRETERRYNRPDVEIRQIYDGPDVENLINISSIPYKSDRTRYFIKYFIHADSVGLVSAEEAGVIPSG